MTHEREAHLTRQTSESSIDLIAEPGRHRRADIETSVPFFDHLLTAFSKHSLIDLTVRAHRRHPHRRAPHRRGRRHRARARPWRRRSATRPGISRFGDALVPLDEALVQAVVDVSGRPYLVHTGEPAGFEFHLIGGHFTGSMVRHVFEAIAFHAMLTVHVTVLAGRDPHHIAEAEFKAFARALRQAVALDPRVDGIPSTKGAL